MKSVTLRNLQCKSYKGKDITQLEAYFTLHADDRVKGNSTDASFCHMPRTEVCLVYRSSMSTILWIFLSILRTYFQMLVYDFSTI